MPPSEIDDLCGQTGTLRGLAGGGRSAYNDGKSGHTPGSIGRSAIKVRLPAISDQVGIRVGSTIHCSEPPKRHVVDTFSELKRSLAILKWMLLVLNILTLITLLKTFELACKVGAL
jgi:hypothetical protein